MPDDFIAWDEAQREMQREFEARKQRNAAHNTIARENAEAAEIRRRERQRDAPRLSLDELRQRYGGETWGIDNRDRTKSEPTPHELAARLEALKAVKAFTIVSDELNKQIEAVLDRNAIAGAKHDGIE
jgi:hypothetical protein